MSRHPKDSDECKKLAREYVNALIYLQSERMKQLESGLSSTMYLASGASPDPERYITWALGELARMQPYVEKAVPVKTFYYSMAEVAILCAMAAGEYKARALDCVNDD